MKRKSILRKLILLTPIVVLGLTLLFVNFAVRSFGDTAFTFVYNTNVQTVQSFANELKALSEQGIPSGQFSELYTNMIFNFNNEVGRKDAIVTFLVDEAGQTHHSSDYNRAYLAEMLQREANMSLVSAAFASRGAGEIALDNGGSAENVYYHGFYSGPNNYTLFLCVERSVIDRQLDTNGVIIPLSVIGLLLLFALEYIIWLKLLCVRCGACRRGSEPEESVRAESVPVENAPEEIVPVENAPEEIMPVENTPEESERAESGPKGSEPSGD